MMEKIIRLGIVGAGRLGSFHAEKAAKRNDVQLTAVLDPCPDNRRRLAEKYNLIECETPEKMFELVDAVVIASPSCLHFELGQKFLSAEKHLLMEKPFAVSGDQAFQLVHLAEKMSEKKNLVVQTGHVEAYNPIWRKVLPLMSAIRAQKPCLISARRTSGYAFRCTDVGVILDMMIHDIDLIRSLVPAPVTKIQAKTWTVFGGEEDVADVRLTFANGSTANIFASRIEQAPCRQMEIRWTDEMQYRHLSVDFSARSAQVISADASICSGQFAPAAVAENPSLIPAKPAEFMTSMFAVEKFEAEPIDALSLEAENFADAIFGRSESLVSGVRGAHAVALAEAILDAAEKE